MSSTRVGPDVSEDGEPTSGPSATKGPMLNGSAEAFLTPELLYKMNKKIAQLTKVVYGLNTRGEELECQLGVSKEAEEKTRALNNDLQHRVNTFKSKIENEMGKLRDLENQANQSQIWKLECENLQRRLDAAESSKMGGESFLAMAKARDEIDQYKRRESSLQYELDQARHAINSLKAHHDFIMRERTAQQAMENEKILLEWQTRCAELEARYKSQIRRLTDDREVLTSECDILRGRKSREKSSTEETILRDQVMALQMQYETDRREWEAKCRILKEDLDAEKTKHNRVKDELEDEGIKHSEERRELIRKLQHRGDDNKKDDMWEERIRNKTATLDERIKDLSEKNAILQSLLDDKEEEFELRLKTKVVEWKSEWELAEEELHKEIKKLKNENALIKSETNAKRFSNDGSGSVKRIKELEEELRYKSGEMNSKAKDFEVRLNTIENENARLRHEKLEWQKVLEGEKERAREKNKSHEIWDKNKEDFQNRLLTLKDTEKMLREANRIVEEENEVLKKEKEELNERIKIKEKEWQLKLENEVKNTETRITKKIERIWLEKLKLSEESSSYDLEKTQEANRRREEALKREVNIAKQVEEDTKRINEELKKKYHDLQQSESISTKALKDSENEIENLRRNEASFTKKRKELAAQEDRYKKQVDDLTRKLGEKQQEVKDLSLELKESRQATLQKDFSAQRYETQIEELKTQIKEQETKTEGVRVELRLSKNEFELSKAKMRHLEEELSKANELTNSLREQNTSRSRESARYKELEDKVKSLEDRLKKSEFTRRDLETSLTEIETERDEELKIVQGALDEAAEEREELISSFKRELELLNTTNTAREQQMLDDFEWKLHEMEKEYKTKLEENNRLAEERLRTMRSTVESELSETLSTVTEERKIADEKLMKVGHLMSYEAEVIQLRGVTHEFQKSLRSTARELESMKVRERLLNEEIRSLKTGAQSRQNTLQRVKRHADEEEVRQKLEKLRNEINAEWEDKLRQECSRLKSELDKLHSEEKHLAVESMKVQKEQETQRLKKSWEQRREEMANQITSLKDTLSDKEAYYRRELDNRRTTADRDVWDLRMKLQKLNESSFDQKQLLEEKYTEDTERLKVDYEDRIKELESRLAICDAQKGIDMIGQLEKEHKLQMQHVGEQHQLSMERLQEELEGEKFQAVEDARVIITNHHLEIESNLREQLTEMQKNESQIRDELEAVRFSLQRREEALRTLEDELDRYRDLKGDSYSSTTSSFPPATSTTSSGFSSSQFSLASSNDSHGSRNSQDRYSIHDSASLADCQDESQRNSGLLGKVFGGGWFTPSKSYNRRGSTPLSSKKPYS